MTEEKTFWKFWIDCFKNGNKTMAVLLTLLFLILLIAQQWLSVIVFVTSFILSYSLTVWERWGKSEQKEKQR
jgi:hypothetical protein